MNDDTLPDPGPVMQALTAYWVSGALKGALTLDLFTLIGQGATSAEALASASHASLRGVRILADAMCSLGFVTKQAGAYGLTPVADTYMRRDRPTFLADFHRFVQSEPFWEAFGHTGVAARSGRSVMDRDALTPENELWVTFAESSLPMAIGTTQPILGVLGAHRPGLRILDVAAGSGGYGITLAQAGPDATLSLLDWPNVLEVATRHARQLGVTNVQTRPGSALESDWGGPYDIVVAGNFFHHFGPDTCVEIAKRARQALAPGGVFATTEFVADPERQAPGMALLFAAAMLVWTDEGNAYTFSELESFLHRGGFASVAHHLIDQPSSWLVARPD
jgi:2-polyprenyl-3-methyl-5-hydroxy-6-metoxy-1,4-benzoquinol methylase